MSACVVGSNDLEGEHSENSNPHQHLSMRQGKKQKNHPRYTEEKKSSVHIQNVHAGAGLLLRRNPHIVRIVLGSLAHQDPWTCKNCTPSNSVPKSQPI
jgi:hypothetical protein